MLKKQFPKRPNWVQECNRVGFDFCNLPSRSGEWYWKEGTAYELTLREVDALEEATAELHAMCMEIVRKIVQSGDYPPQYGLADNAKMLVEQSWKCGDKHLYGRFDFAFKGTDIKMLEYNADTPTGLLEAAVVQWDWVQQTEGVPNRDQFNSIHDKLVDRWKLIGLDIAVMPRIFFCATNEAGREDWGNLEYLADTAVQAGIDVSILPIEEIGWNGTTFVDMVDKRIPAVFKLYPWEWMMNPEEPFGQYIIKGDTRWIEPAWKMLLSNKAILPLLWEEHGGHPLLLPAYFDDGSAPTAGKWVRKPLLAREGANISLVEDGELKMLSGSDFIEMYARQAFVLQQMVALPTMEGFYPVVGSWIIGDDPAGIGIRDDPNLVTGNDAHFIPHYFVEKKT